jgi:hypothetical protein
MALFSLFKRKPTFENLVAAIVAGDNAGLESLLGSDTDVNIRGQNGVTPLMSAVNAGNRQAVKMLIDSGADVNAELPGYGTTALLIAIEKGYNDIAQLLREEGATEAADHFEPRSDEDVRKAVRQMARSVAKVQLESFMQARQAFPDAPSEQLYAMAISTRQTVGEEEGKAIVDGVKETAAECGGDLKFWLVVVDLVAKEYVDQTDESPLEYMMEIGEEVAAAIPVDL